MRRTTVFLTLLLVAMAPSGDVTPVLPPVPAPFRPPEALIGPMADRVAAFRRANGAWTLRLDADGRTPIAALGPGHPVGNREDFVTDWANLAGISREDLGIGKPTAWGQGSVSWRYNQTFRGAPVEGGHVDLVARTHDRIGLVISSARPVRLSSDPLPGEDAVLGTSGNWSWAKKQMDADEVAWVDRDGNEVLRYTLRQSLDLTTWAREPGDGGLTVPAREMTVFDAFTSELTDDSGIHGLSDPYGALFSGTNFQVVSAAIGSVVTVDEVIDDTLVMAVDVDASATNAWQFANTGRDWLSEVDPTHAWPDQWVPIQIDLPYNCNAFYTGGGLYFFVAGYGCADTGELPDVILHEYGHGMHEYGLVAGTWAGDISEGSADYAAATVFSDPVIGLGFYGPYTALRELDTDRKYPDHFNGEVHNDGLIWGSFWWDVRELWDAAYPDGIEQADGLFVETLRLGPTLATAWEVVVAADDDDGDFTNGTPHLCDLTDLLDVHGIGPGLLGPLQFAHEPVPDAPSNAPGATVLFTLTESDCSHLDPASVTLSIATNPPGGATLDAISFSTVPLVAVGNTYSAELQAVPAGTEVAYFMSWQDVTGAVHVDTHDGSASGLYRFFTGDRAALWCDDFELGAGAWISGPGLGDGLADPSWVNDFFVGDGSGLHPAAPVGVVSGAFAYGTGLDGDGVYSDLNGSFAESPGVVVAVDGARSLLFLEYNRWLGVEQGIYDHAVLQAIVAGSGIVLYENPPLGDVVDTHWTPVRHDLRAFSESADPVSFRTSLWSDPYVHYAGWNLDDLCVTALADPVGHYTVLDLSATAEDGVVTLTLSAPWVRPIADLVVLRSDVGFPSNDAEGTEVARFATPNPGEALVVVDPTPGELVWYVAYASDAPAHPYGTPMEGLNAVMMDLRPPLVDTGAVDTGTVDTGTVDTGTVDTGVDPVDTGVDPVDTGVDPVDTGMAPIDSGDPPADTEPDPTETDTTETDTTHSDTTSPLEGEATEEPAATCGCASGGSVVVPVPLLGLALFRRRRSNGQR